jgi:CheY-like chemotaxis protein
MAGAGLNILIGDASLRVRFGLCILLEQHPGWRVAREVEDAQSLLEAVRCGCPDLVLLDWELPGMPALGTSPSLRAGCRRGAPLNSRLAHPSRLLLACLPHLDVIVRRAEQRRQVLSG